MNRVFSFISAIVTLIISSVLLYICYEISFTSNLEGLAQLSYIILIPIYILLFVALFGTSTASVFSSIKAIGSESKAIKIISIILLICALAVVGMGLFLLGKTIKIF